MLKPQQNFVRDYHNVFKVPVAMLEDVELNTQLSKLVSDLLCSIHGNNHNIQDLLDEDQPMHDMV
jgi:hypothetical protein